MESLVGIVLLALIAWELTHLFVPGGNPAGAPEKHGFFCAVSSHGRVSVTEVAGFSTPEARRAGEERESDG